MIVILQFNKSMKKKVALRYNSCPICEYEYLSYLFEARDYVTEDEFLIYKCSRCDISFTKPELPEEQLKKYYGEFYYGNRKSFSERLMNNARIKKIFKLYGGAKNQTVLDIGCGNGSFLSLLQNYGWIISGTEMSPKNHFINKGLSSKIYLQDFLDCRFYDNKFDLVTMWHSLEHVKYPRHYISEAKRILKYGGFLIIEIPNFQSWQARLTKSNWFHLDVPRHISHYSPKSIATFLNSSGFFVSKISHFSFIYGIFGFTQSIINVFTKRNNLLFDFMNGKVRFDNLKYHNISFRDVIVTIILLPPVFLFCAVPLTLLESLFKKGGVITIYAKNDNASGSR